MEKKPNVFGGEPLVIFFIGMAGSGKTTLVHRTSIDLSFIKKNHYIINLDPASITCPYSPNIDIRDTIDYKKIMSEYFLGPNGAILTSLNLFATRFHQVKKIIEKNELKFDYILIDTPGQVEIFTWSASGSILCEAFSANYPTIILFVIDLARSINPLTFISNILYSCGVLYRTRLTSFMIINKKDITSMDFLREWLTDFESFDNSITKENFFAGTFARSLALTLDNFHKKTFFIGLSAFSGIGAFRLLSLIKRVNTAFNLQFQLILENHLSKIFSKFRKGIFEDNIVELNGNKTKNILKDQKLIFKNEKKQENLEFFFIYEYLTTLKIENDKIYLLKII